MTDLTLWHIEAELADLVNLREQMAEAGEDLAPIEQTILEYVGRELRKVDGIRSYLKRAEMMVHAAKNEAKLQNDRANAWQARIDRLKEFCRLTMEAWGAKRLDGSTGSLLLKGDGGRQAVTITDASLIPEELVTYQGTITDLAWDALRHAIAHTRLDLWEQWTSLPGVKLERIPHKGRIGERLTRRCPTCEGRGIDRIITEMSGPAVSCSECGGDGLARVPGARLEPRGNHVEVK